MWKAVILGCLLSPAAWAEQLTLTEPDCDGASVQVIDENSDWANINGTNKYYCVQSGDYTPQGVITLTASGSDGDERWIIYDGDDVGTHPVKQDERDRAIIAGLVVSGGYWNIQGMTIRGTGNYINHDTDGDNVTFDFNLVEGGGSGLGQHDFSGGDSLHIQRSVYRDTDQIASTDTNCLATKTESNVSVHIYGNELYNCAGDAILVGNSAGNTPTHEGIHIVDNDIYILADDMYTDGSGNPDPNGTTACAEGAIDIKQAADSSIPSTWMIVSGNRIWGFRKADTACGGTGAIGDAIGAHQDANYVLIQDNIIFDNELAILFGTMEADHVTVYNNLIANIRGAGLRGLHLANFSEFHYNTFVDVGNVTPEVWIDRGSVSDSLEISCNAVLNTHAEDSEIVNDYNAYFAADRINNAPHDLVAASVATAAHTTYTFTTGRWTGLTIRSINNAVIKSNSPHWHLCDLGAIGTTADRGVDDNRFDSRHAGFVPPVNLPAEVDIVFSAPDADTLQSDIGEIIRSVNIRNVTTSVDIRNEVNIRSLTVCRGSAANIDGSYATVVDADPRWNIRASQDCFDALLSDSGGDGIWGGGTTMISAFNIADRMTYPMGRFGTGETVTRNPVDD